MRDGELLPVERFMQPRVEAEVALVLDRPLDRERHSIEDIEKATAYAVAAIEIVDSCIAKWDIRLADTVADNASSGGYVLGSARKKLGEIDLVGCRMTMERGREVVSQGHGRGLPGQPVERRRVAGRYNGEAWPPPRSRRRGADRCFGSDGRDRSG